MLLCCISIKVKLFERDGDRGLKWARVQPLLHAAAVFFLSYMGRVSRIVWPLHHPCPCVVSQCPVWSSPRMSLHAGAGSVSHEFVVVVLDGQAAIEQPNIVQQLQTMNKALFRCVPTSKFLHSLSITSILGHMHRSVNVCKKITNCTV
jgi:hypothetical protein